MRALPAERYELPAARPGSGPGRLAVAVCALAALVSLEPRLLVGLSLQALSPVRMMVHALWIAAGQWGWL